MHVQNICSRMRLRRENFVRMMTKVTYLRERGRCDRVTNNENEILKGYRSCLL